MGGSSSSDPRKTSSQIGWIVGLLTLIVTIPLAKEIGAIGFIIAAVVYFVVSAIVSGFLKEREDKKLFLHFVVNAIVSGFLKKRKEKESKKRKEQTYTAFGYDDYVFKEKSKIGANIALLIALLGIGYIGLLIGPTIVYGDNGPVYMVIFAIIAFIVLSVLAEGIKK